MKRFIYPAGKWLLAGSMLAMVAACGGGGEEGSDAMVLPGLVVNGLGDQPAETLFNPWLASVRFFRADSFTPGSGDARVGTIQYSDTRTFQQHIDFYSGNLEPESCEVNSDDTGGGGGTSNVPYVDGGNAVVINAPNGIWYTIGQSSTGIYEVDNELPEAIPAGSTVSIPGNVFPSVGAIPITEPAVPVRLLPLADVVSVDSQYQWEGVGGAGVSMQISFLEYDSAGSFVDFRITCYANDDGDFTLPAEALDAIANNTNTLRVRFTRVKRSLDLVEGVVVFSRVSVAE